MDKSVAARRPNATMDDHTTSSSSIAAPTVISTASHHPPLPSAIIVHASLLVAQLFFGLGSVIGALGLPATNPIAFALYREVTAGVILLLAAFRMNRGSGSELLIPAPIHRRRFLLLGLMIFGNQAGFIAGIKLAGPVSAAVWQPSQPIMTAAICMTLGWEGINYRRIGGIVLAFGGCAVMVLLSSQKKGDEAKGDDGEEGVGPAAITHVLYGHAFFFINCLGTSLYVILSKKPLTLYPSLVVTAWSYVIGAVCMSITAVLVSTSSATLNFLCPECESAWRVPSGAFFALGYYILFASVGSYGLLTWSNRYATGTMVMGYTVLQPVTAAILTTILLGMGWYPRCDDIGAGGERGGDDACLDPVGWGSVVGMAGVFGGLALVIRTEPKGDRSRRKGLEGEGSKELELSSGDGGAGLLTTEIQYQTVAKDDELPDT